MITLYIQNRDPGNNATGVAMGAEGISEYVSIYATNSLYMTYSATKNLEIQVAVKLIHYIFLTGMVIL